MLPLRLKLLLAVTSVCLGVEEVSGYYVLPYGYDHPFEPFPEPITIRPITTPAPATTEAPPMTTTPPPPETTTAPPPCVTPKIPHRDRFLIKSLYQYNYYYPHGNRMPVPVHRPIDIQTEEILTDLTNLPEWCLHNQAGFRFHQTAPLRHPEPVKIQKTTISGPNLRGTVMTLTNDNSPDCHQQQVTSSVVHNGLSVGGLPMGWQGISASWSHNDPLRGGRPWHNFPPPVYQSLNDPQTYPVDV